MTGQEINKEDLRKYLKWLGTDTRVIFQTFGEGENKKTQGNIFKEVNSFA